MQTFNEQQFEYLADINRKHHQTEPNGIASMISEAKRMVREDTSLISGALELVAYSAQTLKHLTDNAAAAAFVNQTDVQSSLCNTIQRCNYLNALWLLAGQSAVESPPDFIDFWLTAIRRGAVGFNGGAASWVLDEDAMMSPWVDARYFKYWELSRDDHVSDAAMLTALKALCKPVVLVREGTRANPSRHTILIVMDVDGYRCLDTYHPNTGRSLDDLLLGVNRADGPETCDVKYFYGYC